MRRLLLSTVLAGFTIAAALAPAAHASTNQLMIFDAAEEVTGSLCCGSLTGSALDEADALGSDAVRVLFYWRDVVGAPDSTGKPPGDSSDPAWSGYAQPSIGNPGNGWGKYDEVIKGIVARGMLPVLVPTGRFPDGRVPRWASQNASKDGTDPDPNEWGLFLKALARRYRGGFTPLGGLSTLPAAYAVGVWNEINSPFYFQPQIKNGAAYAPSAYRALYAAGRQGLLEGGFQGQIWMAELAPRGTSTTQGALQFTRSFLCLKKVKKKRGRKKGKVRYKARCAQLRADAFAHHPHSGPDIPFRVPFVANKDVTMGNIGSLAQLLRQAAAAGAINSMPLVLDEYGVQSNPPDDIFGVPVNTQAEWINIAEYLSWSNKNIAAHSQYLLRDDLTRDGFQSGLRFRDGTTKPAYDAFRTPLVIRKTRGKCVKFSKRGHKCMKRVPPGFVKAWGHVRPVGSAVVQIERNDGGAWAPATGPFNTDAAGYFIRKLGYRKGRRFRLVWFDAQDGITACPGSCIGPSIGAYRFD